MHKPKVVCAVVLEKISGRGWHRTGDSLLAVCNPLAPAIPLEACNSFRIDRSTAHCKAAAVIISRRPPFG